MKFYVGSKETGYHFKYEIERRYEKNGNFISVAEIKDLFRENATDDDRQTGWDGDAALIKKMRVRNCKDGWYLYLSEPNATFCFDKNDRLPNIDVSVFPTESFEKLIEEIVELRLTLSDDLADIMFVIDRSKASFHCRSCIVKAKKSGRKEERQDRNAKFHRWADLSKGVQQVVAIVEFDDGHVEQVQPDRVIFKEAE